MWLPKDGTPTPSPWWKDGFIYQVYPRSFADGNGDGVGDLEGLSGRLDHLAWLGAAAVWLTPIYPSGGLDGGYDVTDYRSIDPVYGDLDSFDRALHRAHDLGLKMLLDFVPNHTSDQHPWFVESRSSRTSPKRHWYLWADPKEGGPPNNWASSFGGSAWVWDQATAQYYLASFYPQQPDLNWEDPEVRAAVIGALRFWVDRGVDGFRLDVIHKLSKDALLRDNPPDAGEAPLTRRHDENGPKALDYVREVRRAVGPGVALLGEVWLLDLEAAYRYVGQDLLDMAFNFPLAMSPWNARAFEEVIERTERITDPLRVWPVYHVGNHDMPRPGTRYGVQAIRPAAVMQLTLRGTPVIYQGDEIGMVDGEVPPERANDKVGRDGCRTPMQWDPGPNAGFCPPDVQPWLPVAANHPQVNVEVERTDPDSVLSLYRRLLGLRASLAALRTGHYGAVGATRAFLAYVRRDERERFLVAINFGLAAANIPVGGRGTVAVATDRGREGEQVAGTLPLKEFQAVVVRLQDERTAGTP